MKWLELPKATPRVLRQFSAAWLVMFGILAFGQGWVRYHPTAGIVLALAALPGIIGLWQPLWVRWLFLVAAAVAFPIGWVVTQLVLLVMFYLILTPIAFCLRWFGHDPLQLRAGKRVSYWIKREKASQAEQYLKPY
jgi:hypothetical protein